MVGKVRCGVSLQAKLQKAIQRGFGGKEMGVGGGGGGVKTYLAGGVL